MRTTEKVMVEKEITTYSCDIKGCGFSTTSNSGCCGQSPIMSCDLCGKDACGKHRESKWENEWEDYPDMTICDECLYEGNGNLAWSAALQTAGRYESMRDKTKEIFETWTEEDYEEILL